MTGSHGGGRLEIPHCVDFEDPPVRPDDGAGRHGTGGVEVGVDFDVYSPSRARFPARHCPFDSIHLSISVISDIIKSGFACENEHLFYIKGIICFRACQYS